MGRVVPELARELGISATAADYDDDEVVDGRIRQRAGDQPGQFEADIERPKTTFGDVGGMDAVKEEIRMKIILPLEHPEMFEAYGKKVGGGILMYGPPGCGKTYLARATAGEVKAAFLSIGISDVLSVRFVSISSVSIRSVWFVALRSTRPSTDS